MNPQQHPDEDHVCLIVSRAQIPMPLGEAQRRVLDENLEIDSGGLVFFFRDCPEVRSVLGLSPGGRLLLEA
jgi:hypothetical protein